MEHLLLEIFDLTGDGSKRAFLEKDASITITDTSEIFASGDVWSHSFTLNVQANAHIFGTAGDMHGSRLHDQINKRRARLWVEGVPMYLGYLKLEDDAEVDEEGNVDVSFESGQKTFENLIEGAKANQVPMMSDVQIGVALLRKRYTSFGLQLSVGMELGGQLEGVITSSGVVTHEVSGVDDDALITKFEGDGEDDNHPVQEYPQMVFPKGDFVNPDTGEDVHVNFLNMDYPYTEDEDGTPTHPYCNIALCYQKYGYKKKDDAGNEIEDYDSEPEAEREYEEMPADRVNSAPNFYVIYWLRALMKHLGIHVEENQMLDVEDLRRLFFVNTKCAYKVPKFIRNPFGYEDYSKGKYKRYKFNSNGRLVAEMFGPYTDYYKTDLDYVKREGIKRWLVLQNLIKPEECGLEVTNCVVGAAQPDDIPISAKKFKVTVAGVAGMSNMEKEWYESQNSWLHDAFAKSDCFPDVDISEVISALENGFGIRFLFSDNFQRVRIVLLRNIFRSDEVQDIRCDIISDVKVENNIRGFRLTYGNTEDTQFYYKGFADKLPHKKQLWPDESDTHDYSQWELNAQYHDLLDKASAFNKVCYVTPVTGNAYGVKVDKDAKRYKDLHPSLFEFAGFMDAEDGDCTGEEDTIHEINMGFTPAIMNDLNMANERGKDGTTEQRFALFVDEKMRPRRPDLKDGTDYNDPTAVYKTDGEGGLYELAPGGYDLHPGRGGDGYFRPGQFAITSDMPVATEGRKYSAVLRFQVTGSPFFPSVYEFPISFDLKGHVNEGYMLYLQDNYEPNDDGISPIETHDWGLTLGIMRGSGGDGGVDYEADPDDEEGNATWELKPGSNATAHADTCDCYGKEWNYGHEYGPTTTAKNLRDAGWNVTGADDAVVSYTHHVIITPQGGENIDFLCTPIRRYYNPRTVQEMGPVMTQAQLEAYVQQLYSQYGTDIAGHDTESVVISINTEGSTVYADGRLSLKLRAEKPNPYYKKNSDVPSEKNRYLTIENANLRNRGLADTMYPEFSYWMRNARIAKRTVKMDLAQFLAIDKTKKVRVGDITGFIRKRQFTVSNETGMGEVTMEIMYL